MARQSIIDQYGMGPRIQELFLAGETSRDAIAGRLSRETKIKISGPTVGRYLAKIKTAAADSAFEKIRAHVDRVVPDDLDALEGMEQICLEWSREAAKDQIERTARAAVELPGEISFWISLLNSSLPEEEAVRHVIKRAVFHVNRDNDLQERRLKAMRQATSIIELKLRQAGLLDPEVKGQVLIVDRSSEYYEKAGEKSPPGSPLRKGGGAPVPALQKGGTPGRTSFRIVGGKDGQ